MATMWVVDDGHNLLLFWRGQLIYKRWHKLGYSRLFGLHGADTVWGHE